MKFTTANVKKPHYQDKHVVFLGTHTGSFKRKKMKYTIAFYA